MVPSGVRVTHLPTGLRADSHHERSQHRNNDLAMRLLAGMVHASRPRR
jgi:protein subunit release factor A